MSCINRSLRCPTESFLVLLQLLLVEDLKNLTLVLMINIKNNVLPQTVNSLPPSSNTRVWSFIGFILTIICFLITFIILTQVIKYLPSVRPDERINQNTIEE